MNTKQVERLVEQIKRAPKSIDNFSVKELQAVAGEAMNDIYSELMDLLQGNEPAKKLLQKHNALEFLYYEPDHNGIGDIQEVKEIVIDLWAKKETVTRSAAAATQTK